MKSVTEMLIAVLSKSSVTDQTITVLQSASTSLLTDEEVKTESRKLVANIMGDDSLQRESGEALWNSVLYALQPGVIRFASFCSSHFPPLLLLRQNAFCLMLSSLQGDWHVLGHGVRGSDSCLPQPFLDAVSYFQ